MKDWEKILMNPDATLLEAMRILEETASQIVLVVDENRKLMGTLTDGDIRRALIKKSNLDSPVSRAMYTQPVAATTGFSDERIMTLMRQKRVAQVPVINGRGRVVDVKFFKEWAFPQPKENWVVLMAGGLGTRLIPLTNDCPKPLLKLGDKPVLEIILESLIGHGFHKYFISVNYMAEQIEAYFQDGCKWEVEIRYLKEKQHMGTAGALSLLPERPERAFLMVNGDLLTKVDYHKMLTYHEENRAVGTMAVRESEFVVPYGVVDMQGDSIRGIEEKPTHKYIVNSGIYALNPEVLDYVPKDRVFDMTQLFESLIQHGLKVLAFPIYEYWLDVGRIEDLQRAEIDYKEIF